ncbi:MAG TPA: hypothetical protein VFL90_13695 [Methylomirabilota bacterium]|nr:hypothetical protein [Methylomirabilota bacterium]
MRSPIQPAPMAVQRWIARARRLRWLDFVVAWLAVLAVCWRVAPDAALLPAAIVALVLVAVVALAAPLRVRWRPVSGLVGFLVSRALRPGDRAWYVRGERADLVIVTARRGLRVSIAAPELGAAESISVRRTRVLVVPEASAA